MLALSEQGDGLRIALDGRDVDCELWREGQVNELRQAQRSELPYAPLCGDRLYLRNPVAGSYTHLERVTNFLRDHVWGGEKIVGFVKQEFYRDAFLEKGGSGGIAAGAASPHGVGRRPVPGANRRDVCRAYDRPRTSRDRCRPGARRAAAGTVVCGSRHRRNIHQRHAAGSISVPVSRRDSRTVNELDAVEAAALDYMVAMDLSKLDLGFALGTDHPRVGWSERVLESARDPKLPGPDGIGSVAPLVVNGMMSPPAVELAAATFAGGFKREHGAFRYGVLASQNHGSHYGFIEQGVIFSKLQPGLATLIVDDSGTVRMKTWFRADDAEISHIKHARQNGVPLIEYDEKTGTSSPGSLVNSWGPGNWSGSSEEHLRTLRAGACLLGTGHAALPGLRLLFGCDAERHGARFPGLRLPICHASRYECARAHLFCRLPARGRQDCRAASDRRHGGSRPQGRR